MDRAANATTPWIVAAALLVAGCAATPRGEGPKILRLTPEEAARIGFVYPKPVTLDEVVALTRAGTAPQEIVRRMQETASVYRLTGIEFERLEAAGVDPKVLEHMTAAQRAEAEAAQRRALEEEAWRRSAWYDPYWPYGPYYGPYWGPAMSVGVFRDSHHSGYGVGLGVPWWW